MGGYIYMSNKLMIKANKVHLNLEICVNSMGSHVSRNSIVDLWQNRNLAWFLSLSPQ